MKNTLTQGFTQLYVANEKYLSDIEFKEGMGDFKRAIESSTNQVVDVDPIETAPLNITTDGGTPVTEPTVKEDAPTVGEIIIADMDDEVTPQEKVDGAPAGSTVSVKDTELSDIAGVSSFANPMMDDFLGETEGTPEEDRKDQEKHPDEVAAERLCRFLINDPLNAKNVEHIEEASTVLAKNFNKVYADLKTKVKPKAEELAKEIDTAVKQMMDADGSTTLADSLQVTPPTISHVNWHVLSRLGTESDMIAEAKLVGGLRMTNVMNFTAARAVTNKWMQEVESTDIPESVKEKIITKVETISDSPQEAGIDAASNPDTPEGQVAAGESYLRSLLSGDIQSDGAESGVESEDKQTHAHSPEEAMEEAKETFTIMSTDRRMSGGVRDANPKLHAQYLDKIARSLDTNNYKDLSAVKVNMLMNRVDTQLLPKDAISMMDKQKAFAILDYFKDNRLKYKDLSVKLKRAIHQHEESYLRSLGILTESLNKGLGAILDLPAIRPMESLAKLSAMVQKVSPESQSWTLDDIQHVLRYTPVVESYAALLTDLKDLYKQDKLDTADANKIFDFGYYTLETAVALLSVTESYTLSSLYALSQVYVQGLKNTAEKTGIEKLLAPRMDDFLTEEEDAKQEGDPGKNAIDEEVQDIPTDAIEQLNLTFGTEGIFRRIKDALARNFKSANTKYIEMIRMDVKQFKSIRPEQLNTSTYTFYNKEFATKCLNAYASSGSILENYKKALLTAVRKNAYDNNTIKASEMFIKQCEKMFGTGNISYEKIATVIESDSLENESTVAKCGYVLDDIKKLDKYIQFHRDVGIPFINQMFNEVDSHLPEEAPDGPIKDAALAILGVFLGADYVLKEYVKSLYIVFQMYNRAMDEGNEGYHRSSIAREVYNTIATQAGYYRFIKTMERAIHSRDTGRQIQPLLRVVDKYPAVLNLYDTLDFGISDKDTAILKQNVRTVRGILSCVGLYLTVCRDYFNTNQVLILDESHVNPAVLQEFTKQSGKEIDIENHLLHLYILPKRPVPNMGIRVADVLKSAKRITEEHTQKVSSIKQQLKINKDGLTQAIYTRVLDKYLKSTPQDKLPAGMTLQNYVKSNFNLIGLTSKHVNDTADSIDGCIMEFLVKLWYGDKPVYQDMLNKLEYRYRQVADMAMHKDEMTDIEKATADAKVIADMAMNFLFDQFVER